MSGRRLLTRPPFTLVNWDEREPGHIHPLNTCIHPVTFAVRLVGRGSRFDGSYALGVCWWNSIYDLDHFVPATAHRKLRISGKGRPGTKHFFEYDRLSTYL